MEKDINMLDFSLNIKPELLSPLSLAYIGDAVYELYVRTHIMKDENMPVNKLHKTATMYVKAKAQSDIIHSIEPMLTQNELAVYKRGRNAHSHTSAKNADIVDYRHATGFEALIGYLYLSKDEQRLDAILSASVKFIDEIIGGNVLC